MTPIETTFTHGGIEYRLTLDPTYPAIAMALTTMRLDDLLADLVPSTRAVLDEYAGDLDAINNGATWATVTRA